MDLETIRRFRRTVRRMQRQLGWQLRDDAGCCGVTLAQCHALLEAAEREEVSLMELAAMLELDTSTVSRTVDGMVKAGLVKRLVNPDDRRYVSIALTPHGHSVYQGIERTSNAYFAEVLSLVPEAKREPVLECLAILAEAIRKSRQRAAAGEVPGRDG